MMTFAFIPRNTSRRPARRSSRTMFISIFRFDSFQAYRALLLSCWVASGVKNLIEKMPVFTMGWAFFRMFFPMFFFCNWLKMKRVNATSDMARVMKFISRRKEKFVNCSVGSSGFGAYGCPSISVNQSGFPKPTTGVWFNFDFIFPSFWKLIEHRELNHITPSPQTTS